MSNVIATSGLTKRYGETVAVDGLSLTVEDGEIYGFLGPNGAGKSTTINLLMDYIRPSDGSISIFGMNPAEKGAAVRQRIGILPDGFSGYDQRTAREHLQLAIETKGVDDDPDERLAQVGLEDARDRPVGGFSRGMTQRLGLGMALVGNPDLLILDEPFQGLDPRGVRTIREIVYERNAEGTTVFFSSHVLGQVELVGDRLGILHEGQLVADGTVEELQQSAQLGPTVRIRQPAPMATAQTAFRDLDGVRHCMPESEDLLVQLDTTASVETIETALSDSDVTAAEVTTESPSVESIFLAHTDTSPTEVSR